MLGIMKTLALPLSALAAAAVSIGPFDAGAAAPRPNIILIMGDDMGISDLGCYGSEIDTPNLDRLAAGGLRFTQFYNTARCCPTRASLLSGLYPHQAGIGHMMNDRGHDGYRGELNRECLTIAEALKRVGYGTYMAGKWHVTKHTAPDGPKDNWPLGRGFDRFYGTIHGAGSLWDPNSLTRDETQIAPDDDPEYAPGDAWFYTDAISDQTVRYIEEHVAAKEGEPFFCYVSYTAAHWPMHAREETIAKYEGKYDAGYAAVRAARFERMKELGIIAADSELSPQAWEWGHVKNEAWELRCMEVYAAMVDEMDQGIGEIVAAVEKAGQLDNTLIFFLQDNGGCAEAYGRRGGFTPRADSPPLPPMAKGELQTRMQPEKTRDGYPVRTGEGVMPGPADTYIGYGQGWANVSNTPFREYKHWVHEGGISTPLVAHWPAGIERAGELEHQPGHLIDIMATCVELAGVEYPEQVDGNKIKPLEGRSLNAAFKGGEIEREALFWEHEGNCAVRRGDWKLVRKEDRAWELYNIAEDRSELRDRAAEKPELAKELAALFDAYAERADVAPVGTWRANRKPKRLSTRERFELKSGDRLPQDEAPNIAGRGILIEGEVDSIDRDGVIAAQGGDAHGFALVLEGGVLQFVTRVGGKVSRVSMSEKVHPQAFSFYARMTREGRVQLTVGRRTHMGTVTPPAAMPVDGLDVGRDEGGTVGDYDAPFALDGEVSAVLTLLPKKEEGRGRSARAAAAVTPAEAPVAAPASAPVADAKPKRPNPLAPIADVEGLPRVLLIGDSISIGYTLAVRELLAGKANVHRPATNCGSTQRGIASIDEWLGDGEWDVIHFNWGLHDLKFVKPGTEQLVPVETDGAGKLVAIEDYEANLRKLVARLRETGAELIWRNTTPVPEGARGRIVGDAAKYNAVAAKVMEEAGVEIHDLYAFAKEHAAEIQRKADVHYTPEGSRRLAEEVVKVLEPKLADR